MRNSNKVAPLTKTAFVTSPVYLTAGQIKNLQEILKKKFQTDFNIQNIIREEILAGFTVRIDDWHLDASLRTQLNNLRKEIL